MNTVYFITSYDKEDNTLVEQIPTTSDFFNAARAITKDTNIDCIKITPEVYEILQSMSLTLNLEKADYYVERAGDYVLARRA